jgi:hypothetical protein
VSIRLRWREERPGCVGSIQFGITSRYRVVGCTDRSGVWVTLEATVASAIEAGVWAGVGAEVAVASTLVDTVNEGFVRDGVHALPKYGQPSNYPGR